MNAADGVDVCIVSLGYVGETMAATFLDAGMSVLGVERNDERREALQSGRAPIQEPGIDEVLAAAGDRFTVVASLADAPLPKDIVLCVGTPVSHASGQPEIVLDQFMGAIKDLVPLVTRDHLVVVRSTVPIGTCDRLVVPALSEKIENPLVAMCPERTIQRKALHEIRTLPQVIGAASPESFDRAVKLFHTVASCQTLVSCLAAAEAVKLFCLMTDLAQHRASYSRSKVVGESLVHYTAAAVGFPAVIIRPHNVYGPRMGRAHVIPQFIDRALERMDPFPMYGGDQIRAFCYIDDAVTAISKLLTAPMDPGQVVTVNVGNGQEPVEMAETARRVCRVAGYEPTFVEHGAPVNSPKRRQPDTVLLTELTGFVPAVGLDDGIASTFAWYTEHRK